MSEPMRRLSYRKRKKLGLTFSEAFMEETAPHKARSVDRGYATVMSPASEEQGDEQSEWDERQARIDQKDGLSRLMADVAKFKDDEEASDEIFVGEPGMKNAMFSGFIDELDKQGMFEPATLPEATILSFIDELEKLGCLSEEELEKLALRGLAAYKATAGRRRAGKLMTGKVRGGEVSRAPRHTEARQRGLRRIEESGKPTGYVRREAKRGVTKARKEKPIRPPAPKAAPRRPAQPGAARERAAAQRPAAAVGGEAPGVQLPPGAAAAAAPPPPGPGPAGTPAGPPQVPGLWERFTSPMAQGYQQGGLFGLPRGVWEGVKAAPQLGLPAAALAGMTLLPPAMRAMGMGGQQQQGAMPGMYPMGY